MTRNATQAAMALVQPGYVLGMSWSWNQLAKLLDSETDSETDSNLDLDS